MVDSLTIVAAMTDVDVVVLVDVLTVVVVGALAAEPTQAEPELDCASRQPSAVSGLRDTPAELHRLVLADVLLHLGPVLRREAVQVSNRVAQRAHLLAQLIVRRLRAATTASTQHHDDKPPTLPH